jgi:hypothetical protein
MPNLILNIICAGMALLALTSLLPYLIEFDEEKGRLKIGTTAFVICS